MKMARKEGQATFLKNSVMQLECLFCSNVLSSRGMKAILLADVSVHLYSTDHPPEGSVGVVDNMRTTDKCRCRIKDTACYGCGNVVGYNVSQPCRTCLESCNNGHFWMFYSSAVTGYHRLNKAGDETLVWEDILGKLSHAKEEEESTTDLFEECCR